MLQDVGGDHPKSYAGALEGAGVSQEGDVLRGGPLQRRLGEDRPVMHVSGGGDEEHMRAAVDTS
jgi:hypothetical protein